MSPDEPLHRDNPRLAHMPLRGFFYSISRAQNSTGTDGSSCWSRSRSVTFRVSTVRPGFFAVANSKASFLTRRRLAAALRAVFMRAQWGGRGSGSFWATA